MSNTLTVLPFQVQKAPRYRQLTSGCSIAASVDDDWVFVGRFASLAVANDFISQMSHEYARNAMILRVYCDPKDVAKALYASRLGGYRAASQDRMAAVYSGEFVDDETKKHPMTSGTAELTSGTAKRPDSTGSQ